MNTDNYICDDKYSEDDKYWCSLDDGPLLLFMLLLFPIDCLGGILDNDPFLYWISSFLFSINPVPIDIDILYLNFDLFVLIF